MLQLLNWQREETPEELRSMLEILCKYYPLDKTNSRSSIKLVFHKQNNSKDLVVETTTEAAHIHYSSKNQAARAVGSLLAGIPEKGNNFTEKNNFDSLGIMLDCSRNAVMTVEHFKKWLRNLALLGFNTAMLYTEDTYVLTGEPLFGYMRGAYTKQELREIDEYASQLGIEMIGCIQTLGHMEQVLKWPGYKEAKDTESVILPGSDRTYEIIEKMVGHFKSVFRSSRIHIGMDEAWDLGRGNFLNMNGYQRNFDIFNKHLKKVIEIVKKHKLQPMIWSDMYFRMGSSENNYYDENTNIPQDVREKIPEEVSLVYWDYYHEEKDFYSEWIRRHKELGKMPVMASGVWTWAGPWYWSMKTTKAALPCIESCEESGVRELIFTMWGDDGGYCDFDSATAGLAMTAERAFNSSINESFLKQRFNRLFNSDFDTITLASEMNDSLNAAAIIWDDPLLGLYLDTVDNDSLKQAIETFTELNGKLADRDIPEGAGSISHAFFITRSILEKITLHSAILPAYRNKDKEGLKDLSGHILQMVEHMTELEESFRKQWMTRNKPFGFESLQIRLSGCRTRLLETSRRIDEYLNGEISSIPELDERLSKNIRELRGKRYHQLATASCIL